MAKVYNICGSYFRTASRLIPAQYRYSQLVISRHLTHLALFSHQNKLTKLPSCKTITNIRIESTRCYSDERERQKQPALPDLMTLPTLFYLTKGSLWDLAVVWLTKKFLIPNIEKSFDADEFIDGATQAMEVVSKRLAAQEYNELDGLITPKALQILRENINQMTEKQRNEIPITASNITKSYIAEINIQSDKDRNPPWYTVQITLIALVRKQKAPEADGDDSKG